MTHSIDNDYPRKQESLRDDAVKTGLIIDVFHVNLRSALTPFTATLLGGSAMAVTTRRPGVGVEYHAFFDRPGRRNILQM